MEINTLTLITILATALILVIGGFLAIAFYYSQRSRFVKEVNEKTRDSGNFY